MRVFINPGHDRPGFGCLDPGAVNKEWNVQENEITERVGFLVAQYLEDAGIETMVCQQDNLNGESGGYETSVCQRANRWGADLFLSIHTNAGMGTGTECFCYSLGGRSHALARCIQQQIVDSLDMRNRGVKEANFCVLRATFMPATLIELAFIDNDEDVNKLIMKQDSFAKAIARGVTDYALSLGD